MNLLLKAACIAAYALALASLSGLLSPGAMPRVTWVAGGLLAIHALELAASVVLTLLFGLLHWKPLADQAARDKAQRLA